MNNIRTRQHDYQLGIDDLIHTLGGQVRHETSHPDLRDYWSRRAAIMTAGLGLPVDLFAAMNDRESTAGLGVLLRAAVLGAYEPPSPFASFIEAGPPVHDLFRSFSGDLRELFARHRSLYSSIARACLLAYDEKLAERSMPESVFEAGGLGKQAPDLWDYL